MKKCIVLTCLFFSINVLVWAQCPQGTPQSTAPGSPCSVSHAAHPFCTDENPYGVSYPSGTGENINASPFTGSTSASCCFSTPRPAWYYMQIADPGNLLIYIEQHRSDGTGCDVDFVCWGPFTAASQADFVEKLCCGIYSPLGTYSNGNHRPEGGNHSGNMGGYPSGGVVDCSYDGAATEWCYIPNAQTGQWYLLLITNYNGCAGTITFSPVAASSTATTNCNLLNNGDSNAPICAGDTLKMYCTQPVTGATYNWTAPNGSTYSTTNATLAIPNATAAFDGEWQMTMSGISQQASTAVVYVSINEVPTPVINATDHSLCFGESVDLTTDNSSYQYFWASRPAGSTGNYTPIASYVSSINDFTPTQSVEVIVNAEMNECYGTATTVIYVNQYPDIHLSADKEKLCYGEGTSITATGGATYHWSTGSTAASINVTPMETTTYDLTVVSDSLCSSDTSITIIVYPEIIIDHSEEASYCGQPTGKIIGNVSGGMGPFTYTSPTAHFNDNIASNLMGGAYSVTATDSVQCRKEFTANVPSIPNPTACFNITSTDDVFLTVFNCTTGSNNAYYWEFGDGATSTLANPTHEYSDPGSYSILLMVEDEHHCTDSVRKNYAVNGPVYIPNSFTPNGDEKNDILYVIGKSIQKDNFAWYIYDRHGSVAFVSYDPTIGWDGKLANGTKAQPGVYIYRLFYQDANGNKMERDGSITLIR